jgi:hypothetical protein
LAAGFGDLAGPEDALPRWVVVLVFAGMTGGIIGMPASHLQNHSSKKWKGA